MKIEQKPRVGVGVLIVKDGKVLLGKRKGSHGAGEYALPGGHLEYLESFKKCIIREVKEECNITIGNVNFLCVSNTSKFKPKHYITICLQADWNKGAPIVLEPEKCESWEWYSFDNLPNPLFETTEQAIMSYKTGQSYYDLL